MVTENFELYRDYILKNTPRVLTQVDRDRDSKTYGSCDRSYWHMKIRDFSSAILQQTSLTMALLYNTFFTGNIYYKNENVKQWSIASLCYMKKIQLKDGSFNEYYPNEHGYPPTAFALYAACRTYLELEMQDEGIKQMMAKAAEWLCKHEETRAFNQELAAITALHLYHQITLDNNVLGVIKRKLEKVLAVQSVEGWFPEQGGADIGYSSVALDMLAEYYWYSKDESVREPLNRLVGFLCYFVHPDGTIGGEYGSRNTIYFMPNGLETVISSGLECQAQAKSMLQMIYIENGKSQYGNFMESVDERYLSHYVLHSYLRALKRHRGWQQVDIRLPFNTIHTKIFQEAGLLTKSTEIYYCIISLRKGGIIKVYRGAKEVFLDCGYRIPVKEGKVATTNWLDNSYMEDYENNTYMVAGSFNIVTPKIQTPVYHLGLRIAALLLGDRVNKVIKKLTIFADKHTNITFSRKILCEEERIIIFDKIKNIRGKNLREAENYSLRLVASGKFFSRSDLIVNDQEIDIFPDQEIVSIKKVLDLVNLDKSVDINGEEERVH